MNMFEISELVAQFVTTVDIRDIDDRDFSRYEGGLIRICRKNQSNGLLADMIKEYAAKYAVNRDQLVRESKRLADAVRARYDKMSIKGGFKLCRICGDWKPVEAFRKRKTGSIETACWPCEREEKRIYQQGRARKRTRPEQETVVELSMSRGAS